jgi:hypothetical protein
MTRKRTVACSLPKASNIEISLQATLIIPYYKPNWSLSFGKTTLDFNNPGIWRGHIKVASFQEKWKEATQYQEVDNNVGVGGAMMLVMM